MKYFKSYYQFIRTHFFHVSFGWLLTLFSSFGQTYLISLYIPDLIKVFDLSEGAFGNIYAVCTVTAGFIMLTVGYTIDHYPVKRVTYLTILGLIVSLLTLGSAFHPAMLFLAITGLRLTGQGLMGHIGQTVMSREFYYNRGKALSITSLGYSVGEALFPFLINLLIVYMGWRYTAFASGGILLLFLASLTRKNLSLYDQNKPTTTTSLKQLSSDYLSYLIDKRFSVLAPAIFVIPFTVSGIFFFQYIIAENREWNTSLYSTFFIGFALSRFIFTLMGGLWVDKFTSFTLYRLYLFPLFLGLIPLALWEHILGGLIFLLLAGGTVGMSGPVKSSLFAELYGTEKLGTVRSLFTMLLVVSAAMGPLLFGNLMDYGLDLKWILGSLFLVILGAILNAQRVEKFRTANKR